MLTKCLGRDSWNEEEGRQIIYSNYINMNIIFITKPFWNNWLTLSSWSFFTSGNLIFISRIIWTLHHIRLTIQTDQNVTDDMKIVDDDGISRELSRETVTTMIGIAWGTFILAWIMNIAYYKVKHSSSPIISI